MKLMLYNMQITIGVQLNQCNWIICMYSSPITTMHPHNTYLYNLCLYACSTSNNLCYFLFSILNFQVPIEWHTIQIILVSLLKIMTYHSNHSCFSFENKAQTIASKTLVYTWVEWFCLFSNQSKKKWFLCLLN